MRCPFCSSEDTQVKDSRPTEDGTAIRRRRYCPDCGGRFTTFERVQLRELTVLKRSGRRVPFDRGLRDTIRWYQENAAWVAAIRSGDYMRYYERQYGRLS